MSLVTCKVTQGKMKNLLYGSYFSSKPIFVPPYLSDWNHMKTSLVKEIDLGGKIGPQYSPILGAAFEFPSYKINWSLTAYFLLY